MSNAVRDLYRDVVLAHNRAPRNFRVIRSYSHRVRGYNPLCGDDLELYLDIRQGVIRDIAFQGQACAVATASASLLTACLRGRPVEAARAMARRFAEELAGGEAGKVGDGMPPLGEAEALLGVRAYPGREKCAGLAWRALEAAVTEGEAQVSTET